MECKILKLKYGIRTKVFLLRVLVICFSWRWEEHHIKNKVIRQYFSQKLSVYLRRPCRRWQELVKLIVCTIGPVYCFQSALQINTTLFYWLYASVMPSIYAKLCNQTSTCCLSERAGVDMHELCLPTYHSELILHPMPEHIEELSGWVKIKTPVTFFCQLLTMQVMCESKKYP